MMREILFRGQTRLKGEKVNMRGQPLPGKWVYGGVFPQTNGGPYSIIYTYEPIDKWPVYAETVGQYTGLKDRNGTKIFEGDVLEFLNDDGDMSLYTVKWDDETAGWVIVEQEIDATDVMCDWAPERWTVVGNIWDGVKEDNT